MKSVLYYGSHSATRMQLYQFPYCKTCSHENKDDQDQMKREKWCWNERVFVFPKHIHTERTGGIFYPPSYKNVNKPGFKYNDLQHTHRGGRNCKPVLINVALRLSERLTSLNLPSRAPCEGVHVKRAWGKFVHMPANINLCMCLKVGAQHADRSGGPFFFLVLHKTCGCH